MNQPNRFRPLMVAVAIMLMLGGFILQNAINRHTAELMDAIDRQATGIEDASGEQTAPSAPAKSLASVAPVKSAATAPRVLERDDQGCLRPGRLSHTSDGEQRPPALDWVEVGSGDRLREDHCGTVWALWFSSWEVRFRGDPRAAGYVSVPKDSPLAPIALSGVTSFLPTLRGELWVVGRRGDTARYRDGVWQPLTKVDHCWQGDLEEFDGRVWIACGGSGAPSLGVWSEPTQSWREQNVPSLIGDVQLEVSPDGRLLAASAVALAVLSGDGWRVLAKLDKAPTALAASQHRIFVGSDDGLRWFDDSGVALGRTLEGEHINGIALNHRGGAWVAVRNKGLHYFDGARWTSWRYAQGLPDDEARDVVLDARGHLWLGGTPSAMISERAALARILEYKTPAAVPGRIFADACSAAAALLDGQSVSGQIAQVHFGGQHLVFYAGVQVCPNPQQQPDTALLYWRRDADGALLELAHNGTHSSRHCGRPCNDEQRATIARLWRMRVLTPGGADGGEFSEQILALPDPPPEESPGAAMLLALEGDVWLSTPSAGLYQHDGKNWRLHATEEGFEPHNLVRVLAEDARGGVWAGSSPQWLREENRRAGLPLHYWSAGAWQHFPKNDQDNSGPLSGSTMTVVAVPGGVLVGTNGGLALVTSNETRPFAASALDGHGFVSTIAIDAENSWWLGHSIFDEGITLKRGDWVGHLSSRNGLYSDRIRAIAHDAESRVWLLDEDGMVAVYSRFELMERMQR